MTGVVGDVDRKDENIAHPSKDGHVRCFSSLAMLLKQDSPEVQSMATQKGEHSASNQSLLNSLSRPESGDGPTKSAVKKAAKEAEKAKKKAEKAAKAKELEQARAAADEVFPLSSELGLFSNPTCRIMRPTDTANSHYIRVNRDQAVNALIYPP